MTRKKNKSKNIKTARCMLNILVCPDTKSLLFYDEKAQELISIQGKKAYPIEQNVPLISNNHCRLLSANEINEWQVALNQKKNVSI